MAAFLVSSSLLITSLILSPTTTVGDRPSCTLVMQGDPRGRVYTRSRGDLAPVDVRLVERLLCDRTALRRSKDYTAADAVLGELRALDVAVDDETKQWEVIKRGDRREQSKRRTREREQRAQQRASKPRKAAVRKDAPFLRSAACTASLSDEEQAEIASLVAQRLEAKLAKRYAGADALLAKLAQLRVCVADEVHEWRADGLTFAAPYTQELGGADADADADAAEVESLLRARALAKVARDYASADLLLDTLLGLGAVVEDSRRVWRFVPSGRDAARDEHDYRAAGEVALDPRLRHEVGRLLARRLDCKLNHRFDEADALQGSLNALGVEVDDRAGEWTVGFVYTASSWRVRS